MRWSSLLVWISHPGDFPKLVSFALFSHFCIVSFLPIRVMCADTHPTTQKENMNQKNKSKEVLVISSPHVCPTLFSTFSPHIQFSENTINLCILIVYLE